MDDAPAVRVSGWGFLPLPGERRRWQKAQAAAARMTELLERSTPGSELPERSTPGSELLERSAPGSELESALGLTLEPARLRQALTHRSYSYENGGLPTNERLEFLGDSVLGVVITSTLLHDHPDLPEAQIAKLRAGVLNTSALAEVARTLGLGPQLLLGRGEEATGGRDKATILADTLEALLGAIYQEHGLEATERVVHRLFDPLLAEPAGRGAALDWKTSLQELAAALGLGAPDYLVEGSGPTFTARVEVAGERYGGSQGHSRAEAEQRAAAAAWRVLSEQNP